MQPAFSTRDAGNALLCLRTRPTLFSASLLAALVRLPLPAAESSSAPAGRIELVLEAGDPRSSLYTSLHEALRAAKPGAKLRLGPGKYVVDNPIVLGLEGLQIIGADRRTTHLYPKRPGREFFVLAADRIAIRHLSIDALLPDRRGRASLPIFISPGHRDCEVSHTAITNSGASAILAPSVEHCRILNNVIINAGDDGIRMRGSHLVVESNFIWRYFDEAIDLARGQGIIVRNNYVRSGRIGITVGEAADAVVHGNMVIDHHLEGIDSGGILTSNFVIDTGTVAYRLVAPRLVANNVADGAKEAGFEILRLENRTVYGNIVLNSASGIRLIDSNDSLVTGNRFCKGNTRAVIAGPRSVANQLFDNSSSCEEDVLARLLPLQRERLSFPKKPPRGWTPQAPPCSDTRWEAFESVLAQYQHIPTGDRFLEGAEVTWATEADHPSASSIEPLFRVNNPGFMIVHVDANEMTSEVTEDLATTLRGAGQHGIGLVRAPFKAFRGISHEFSQVWSLTHGGKEFAIVASDFYTAEPRIYFIVDGRMYWTDKLRFELARAAAALYTWYRHVADIF